MTVPFVEDPDFTLHVGDVRDVLATLPDESVHCVVTSPPYWGLRDYGVAGQLGLEATPDEYVRAIVGVFREVRRVLRKDGTCWLNLGDSYATHRNDSDWLGGKGGDKAVARKGWHGGEGLKAKDLCGIPWRVAFALQADGWYLRADIVWSKPNAMPESVTDRPTKSHEMVFLLTKAPWKGREPGPVESRLSAEDARWLALLVDAEGNICVKRNEREGRSPSYGAQVAIGSTSRPLLERARDLVGTGTILERDGTNAPMFYWQLSGKQAQDFLYAIYPHLIVKQRQARLVIHMESLLYHRGTQESKRRTEAENAALESLWRRNKECNSFGDPDLSDVPAPKYGRWGESRYFFDQEAVREPAEWARWGDQTNAKHEGSGSAAGWIGSRKKESLTWNKRKAGGEPLRQGMDGKKHTPTVAERQQGRNVRSVWEIATQPYPDAHFATFPEELPRRCIAAGCPEGGTVLDPFLGSGTTALVARRLGRKCVGIELNPAYAQLAARRLQQLSLLAEGAA